MLNEAIQQAFAELDELVGAEPGRVIQPAEWDSLDPAVLAIIPCWYREVPSCCRVGEVGLEVDTETVRLSEQVGWSRKNAGTQTLVAGIATVPRWSSVAGFVSNLIPEGYEG